MYFRNKFAPILHQHGLSVLLTCGLLVFFFARRSSEIFMSLFWP